MVDHKSHKYRAILDLSFELKTLGMEFPSVNDSTRITAPQYSMRQWGKVLPRLIETMAAAALQDENIMSSKLDMKNGFWRMVL